MALCALPFLLAALYAGWFFYDGWKRNPVLAAAGDFVAQDGMAELALGGHIRITGLDGRAFTSVLGLGSRSDYVVTLEGSRGAGRLDIVADDVMGRVRFESMILTGPDGARYDLLRHSAEPAPAPADSI